MPSEHTVTKIDAAITQLDSAIHFYEQGLYIQSLTLAGAADGILGSICKRKKIKNALEAIAELPPLSQISDNLTERFKFLNDPRNNLKHADDPDEDVFTMTNLDALFMIARGLANARLLGIEDTETMRNFRQKK